MPSLPACHDTQASIRTWQEIHAHTVPARFVAAGRRKGEEDMTTPIEPASQMQAAYDAYEEKIHGASSPYLTPRKAVFEAGWQAALTQTAPAEVVGWRYLEGKCEPIYDNYICSKCGAQADERFDCCQVSTPTQAEAKEAGIRRAGLKARDELIERLIPDGGSPDHELADYMERIIDACVAAALLTEGEAR